MDLGRIIKTSGGKWRQATLSAPLVTLPGDVLELDGSTVWQKRAGYYINSSTISEPTDYEPQPFELSQTISTVLFFEGKPMPAAAVTLTDVSINQGTGTVTVNWSDGSSQEYASFESLVNAVDDYDTNTEHAKGLLLLALVRRTPDGSNMDALNGSSITIDGIAATPVQFSLNE